MFSNSPAISQQFTNPSFMHLLYLTELSLFFSISLTTLIHLYHAGRSLKTSLWWKLSSYICNHSQRNHFHFIAVQLASSKVLFQSPKQMVCCMLAYSKCTRNNTELLVYETSLTENASYSQGLHMASDASHSSHC
jgi:hypothetical protein